jgi:hypothetical protein
MMKKVWISALEKDEEKSKKLMETLGRYGLAVNGHFWTDDIPHMAWSAPAEELLKPETALWVIFGSRETLSTPTVAFGLSLLAVQVFARKGQGFPVALILTDNEEGEPAKPTLLKGADLFLLSNPTLGVKLVTLANMPLKKIEKDYHLDVHPLPGIGLWLDVGPGAGHEWKGAMVGVHGGDIDFQAVGPRGAGLPETSSLEYPSKGLKINVGGNEFIAWGVQNHLDGDASYFVRVTGMPDRILFGSFTGDDAPEVNIITLY